MENLIYFLESINNSEIVLTDKNNFILNGSYVAPGKDYGLIEDIIFRIKNGKLDGGKKPAVETVGHIEYWKNGKRHRDKYPAVIKNGFKEKEFWENGKKIEK